MPIRRKSRSSKETDDAPAERVVNSLQTRSAQSLSKHRSYVLYGRSGTGKTTLSATFPGPVLLLDIKDEGTDSISETEVRIKEIESVDDLEEVYWYLKKHPKEFGTVVMDTVSQLQELLMRETLAKKKSKKRPGEWGSMTRQEFGGVVGKLKELITDYRDLPMNVVFIAQERVFNIPEEDGVEGLTPEVGPQLMPSVRLHLNASVSVIANTFIRRHPKKAKEVQYCLYIGPNPMRDTKVRKPKSVGVPELIVDPSYNDIIEIIKGE